MDGHDWISDRFSKGTWLSWPPGWAAEIASQLGRPQGRLAFAGSDIAIEGAGYIEGAVVSGREAAETSSGARLPWVRGWGVRVVRGDVSNNGVLRLQIRV